MLNRSSELAPINGFARCFTFGTPLAKAKITIRENNETIFTNYSGEFSFYWQVGKSLTMVLQQEGYRTTQSATVIVPPEGFSHFFNMISFQVPSHITYKFFSYAMGKKEDLTRCQIAATITAHKKTLNHLPHGEPDTTVALFHKNGTKVDIDPFYFGIFKWGFLKHKTNPFDRSLRKTSQDGGVIFVNVPPGEYTVVTTKAGVSFNKFDVLAEAGEFINISPPLIMADKEIKPETTSFVTARKSTYSQFFKPAFILGAGMFGFTTMGIGTALAGAAAAYIGTQTAESLGECCKRGVKKR
jgi:hypothetical protein